MISGCSYIPFNDECERFPRDLSYNGAIRHFDRDADLYDYRYQFTPPVTKHDYFFWYVCQGDNLYVLIIDNMTGTVASGIIKNTEKIRAIEASED